MEDLEIFYEEYADKVYKYFYVQCLDQHIAEDLTSQTFVEFIAKIQEDLSIKDNKKYLYGIMRNTWANYLRAKYRDLVDSVESIEDFEQHAEESVESFESKTMKERALTFITKLPHAQRQIAYMRLIEEKGLGEIAGEIGKNIFYVKTTQSRAIKSLRAMLEHPEMKGDNV